MSKTATPGKPRHRTSIGARRNPDAEAAILAAARALLVEEGYAAFSIEEVARRAGAGKPTIYRWWPTKADLFIDVYATDKAAAMTVPDSGSFKADLIAYTQELWRYWRETPSGQAFRGLIAEAQSNAAALEALRTKFLPQRLQTMRQMFEAAVARREIAAGDVEGLIELFIGFNWLHVLTGRVDDDAAIETMAGLLAGRGAQRQSSRPSRRSMGA